MKAIYISIAQAIRKDWDYYHSNTMPEHLTGVESTAKTISRVLLDKDTTFKKAEFLRLAINQ